MTDFWVGIPNKLDVSVLAPIGCVSWNVCPSLTMCIHLKGDQQSPPIRAQTNGSLSPGWGYKDLFPNEVTF